MKDILDGDPPHGPDSRNIQGDINGPHAYFTPAIGCSQQNAEFVAKFLFPKEKGWRYEAKKWPHFLQGRLLKQRH